MSNAKSLRYIWVDADGFSIFSIDAGKWKHAKCYPISMRCGMMRWCWGRWRPRRRRRWWWWKCNVQNIIYSNTLFVYKSAVMCHFHGNHVSNSLSLSYFHYAKRLIRFIGDHCQSLLIDAKCVYGRIINFRIFVMFFFWIHPSKKKHYLFFNIFPLVLWIGPSCPGVLWKILSTTFHFQIFIGNTF